MTPYLDVEGAMRAARKLEDAAKEANRAADRLETVLYQLRPLIDDGYGNNMCALIELLRNLPEIPPSK